MSCDSTGKQIATENLHNGSMAPNSWFDYQVGLGNQKLAAGKYTLKLHLTSGKRTWNFSGTFTLTRKQIAEHNSVIKSDEQPTYWWLWLILFLFLSLLLIIGAYLLGKRRSRDDDDDGIRRFTINKRYARVRLGGVGHARWQRQLTRLVIGLVGLSTLSIGVSAQAASAPQTPTSPQRQFWAST